MLRMYPSDRQNPYEIYNSYQGRLREVKEGFLNSKRFIRLEISGYFNYLYCKLIALNIIMMQQQQGPIIIKPFFYPGGAALCD